MNSILFQPIIFKQIDIRLKQNLEKTKLCPFIEKGRCFKSQCHFAHSDEEVRIKPNLTKTRLCISF